MFKQVIGLFCIFILCLGLQSCSDNDTDTSMDSGDKQPTSNVDVTEINEAEKNPPVVEPEREAAQKTVDQLKPEPKPELVHKVVYQEEIYKGWPYQEEARNIPQSSTPVEQVVDMVTEPLTDKAEVIEDKVADTIAEAADLPKDAVSDVIDKGKDMMAAVVPDTDASSGSSSGGKEHRINAEARVFNPAIVYISPGDVIKFDNMTSHNSVSYINPEGAKGWGERGKGLGNNIKVKLEQPGIYGYACDPHIGFGMVGVVVVGDVTADDVAAAKQVAMDTLEGPYKRIIGKINKIKPTK